MHFRGSLRCPVIGNAYKDTGETKYETGTGEETRVHPRTRKYRREDKDIIILTPGTIRRRSTRESGH